MAVLAERNVSFTTTTPVSERKAGGRSRRRRGAPPQTPGTPATPREADGERPGDADGGGIRGLLSPNCDSQERKTARQRKRESIEARIAMLTPHRKQRRPGADEDGEDGEDGGGGGGKGEI